MLVITKTTRRPVSSIICKDNFGVVTFEGNVNNTLRYIPILFYYTQGALFLMGHGGYEDTLCVGGGEIFQESFWATI